MAVPNTFAPKLDVSYTQVDALPKIAKLHAYAQPSTGRSVWQIINTAVPFGLMWFIAYKSLAYSYWITLLLTVPTTLLVIRLFIIQHDAGHGSFFSSRKANDFVGFWIGVLTLSPYQYWQKTHAIHHATSGNLDKRGFGDIDLLTVTEYKGLSRWGQFKYRMYRHPLTMFIVGPFLQFGLVHRLPLNIPKSWKREWKSVHLTNLALLVVGLVAWQTIGFKNFLLVQVPITFLSCVMGSWLFYIQHQYEDTYWRRDNEWDYFEASVKGSSYYVLPKILQWFTGSIGLHHIHHYNSRIPNYRLQKCFDENPEFQNVTRLTLWSSLKCIPLALWNEQTQKLVSFRSL
ncbi:MAG: fatty acid desaturase [Elusimicrobia bacterium]|nr:fatty acid desaturase [Elusimicrobiota bacterium]